MTIRRYRVLGLAISVGAIVLLTACADPAAAPIAATSSIVARAVPSAGPTKLGPATISYDSPFIDPATPRTLDYGRGLVSHPAPATLVPRHSASDAVAAAESQGFDSSQLPGTPQAALRQVDYDQSGGSLLPGESTTPIVGRLSWVLIFLGSHATSHGPAGSTAALTNCEWTTIVDATTNVPYYNVQQCGS